MRRLKSESGFSLILVAILVLVLFAFAGFAVDVGAMYQERRELRNGADAASLAIAQACAADPADPDCSDDTGAGSPARLYADLNADDGSSGVDSVVIDLLAPDPYTLTVEVDTSAEDEDGDAGFPTRFMRILGVDSVDVGATATAAAGPLGSAETPPVIFEMCEWAQAFPEYPGQPAPGSYPTGDVTLFLHQAPLPEDPPACPTFLDPAGKDAPGAFGYLDSTGDCIALIANGMVLTSVGNKPPQPDCKPEVIFERLYGGDEDLDGYGRTIPLPIFSTVAEGGTGSNLVYHVVGLAAFQTKRYNLGGQYCYPGQASECLPCDDDPDTPQEDKNHSCIVGRFVRAAPLGGLGEWGDVDLGAILVRLID